MNNVTNIISTAPVAPKTQQSTVSPADQTLKPIQAPQAGQPAEEPVAKGKSFGEVLARQVSEATQPEDMDQQKKESVPQTTGAQIKEVPQSSSDGSLQTKADPLQVKNDAPETKDMVQLTKSMKALNHSQKMNSSVGDATQGQRQEDTIPTEVAAGAITTELADEPKKSTAKSVDEIFSHFKSKMNKDSDGNVAQSSAVTNPTPELMSSLMLPALANAQNTSKTSSADDLSEPIKPAIDSGNPVSDKFEVKQSMPVANNGVTNAVLSPEAKNNEATFTKMMDTLTTPSATSHLGSDIKDAAIVASPQLVANAQAAMLANSSPIAAPNYLPAQVTINTPVSHDKWGDEFNQKITWLSTQKEQTAELHLNPPQLGPMDVVLKVSGDQATALFTSPHAAVREAVEQALPKLREMMAESGIMLGNATVSDQAPRSRQDENKSSGSRGAISGISENKKSITSSVRVSPIARHNGIVDTFA